MKKICLMTAFIYSAISLHAQYNFNGVNTSLNNIFQLSDAKSRSISAENFKGEKGGGGKATTGQLQDAAKDLGPGWKLSPCVEIKAGQTFTVAEIDGPGSIQHIWMTPTGKWRFSILRMYWDDEKTPSVEVPVGDFFGQGWNEFAPLNSLPIVVNPGSGMNCYWPMPFKKKCRITMENINQENMILFYQVDYLLTKIPDEAAYFHAQFRRTNPTQYKRDYVIVDSIKGKGQYVGTYIAYGQNSNGWWGEGELKFFMDGDEDYPTICSTGTEDYFLGSYGFNTRQKNTAGVEETVYSTYTTPYAGFHQVVKGDGLYKAVPRFGMYRWHISDPIRFDKDLKVTMQMLGWRSNGRYLPLQDDVSSTAIWYQAEPHAPYPALPDRDHLEVN